MAFDLKSLARTLLGVSAYQSKANPAYLDLDDPSVIRSREAQGGQIQPLPVTTLRWYQDDLEQAQYQADAGNIMLAARLYRAMRRDGVLQGLLGTRTSGIVRLPKRFYGNAQQCTDLKAKNGTRSIFDDMCPPSELGLLASDGIVIGIGVGELVPVPGRDFPILIRMDPEFLTYRWVENRWYYSSTAGLLPITPGDGRWVLHQPGGRIAPWQAAAWPALGRSFIDKEHAKLNRSNYGAKLANPARVAVSPLGSGEQQKSAFFQRVMAWATDTVFGLPLGWDVKLIESNGRGIQVWQDIIDTCDKEYSVCLNGQTVSMDGGTGFQNADAFKAIRADLVQDTGDGLAYTVNTQILPQFAVRRYGIEALRKAACVEWNTDAPKDLVVQANSMSQAAGAIKSLVEALSPVVDLATGVVTRPAPTDSDGNPLTIDVTEILVRFNVPLKGSPDGFEPTDESAQVPLTDIESARNRATQPAYLVEAAE